MALVVMLPTMLEVLGKMEVVRRVRININNVTPLIALSLHKVPCKVVETMVEEDGVMCTSSPSRVRVLPRILVSLRKVFRKEIMAVDRVLEIMSISDTIPTNISSMVVIVVLEDIMEGILEVTTLVDIQMNLHI
jgi:hypothetical protein